MDDRRTQISPDGQEETDGNERTLFADRDGWVRNGDGDFLPTDLPRHEEPSTMVIEGGLTRRRSRVKVFVDVLCGEVEEYMGRGGYTLTEDDVIGGERLARHGSRGSGGRAPPGVSDAVGNGMSRGGVLGSAGGETDEGWVDGGDVVSGFGTDGYVAYVSEEDLQKPLLLNGAQWAGELPSEGGIPAAADTLEPRSRGRSSSQIHQGNSIARTVVTFLKGMIGSYVLYLPHMFAEGGILFSSLALVAIATASTYNMLLLLRSRAGLLRSGATALSFGDVGFAAGGRAGQAMIDISLLLSQLGYCVIYFVFVAENLGPALGLVLGPGAQWLGGTVVLVLLQAAIQVPLLWVRRLTYLGLGLLVANICVLVGLALILFQVVQVLVKDGVAAADTGGGSPVGEEGVALFHPSKSLLVLGSVVGCYEGIGLIIPIQDAMDPKKRASLKPTLCWSMGGITVFYLFIACSGYLAFGGGVSHFITMDLPEDTAFGVVTRIGYSVALLLTFPLQAFPAVKIMERWIWPGPAGGKKLPSRRRKWLKNLLRFGVVFLTAAVALIAGDRFDSFVGLVNGLCAVPLAMIYPIFFHMRLFGKEDTPREAFLHWALLVVGVFCAVSTTVVAVQNL